MKLGYSNLIGNRIREIRISQNLSQEDVTAKLNILGLDIDRSALSRIENRHREINDFEILYLARILNVDINNFYIGINE